MKYNRISLFISPIANSIGPTCRPQNVHIAGITLTPTAVTAADTVSVSCSSWRAAVLLHPDTCQPNTSRV